MEPLQIVGRTSSLFTRMPLIFCEELAVAYELVPIHDMTALNPEVYAGNPALKLPMLRRGDSVLFGAQNICRAIAECSTASKTVIWPESLPGDLHRNAQELIWHCMSAQVQIVMGTVLNQLPPDNHFFVKTRHGFMGALAWLNDRVEAILTTLPTRDLSLLEVSLHCLLEHLRFRPTVSIDGYPALLQFSQAFATRTSAQRTTYRFDVPPS